MHYFITGTDTDAGKTYVTSLLIQSLRRSGRDAVGYKPIACGDRLDAHHLHQASDGVLTLEEVNPLYFKVPAAPYTAALLENRPVDLEAARLGFSVLAARHQHVLVEGAGGWEVPLAAPDVTLADFAQQLGLPIILVVNNQLGCLNHTLLTVKNLLGRGLTCAGIYLNHVRDERDAASISNRHVLENFLGSEIPILGDVMHGEEQLEWPFLPE
jgi:dethiobiotin synthetase